MNAPPEPEAPAASRARVLLADDSPATFPLVEAALAAVATVVGTVANGRELLAAVDPLKPEAVVLDITMPEMNGIEAARAIHRSHPEIKLVFLTVHEDADYARAALAAGGLGYVVKSRLASDLLPAVQAALAGRSFLSPTIHLGEAA